MLRADEILRGRAGLERGALELGDQDDGYVLEVPLLAPAGEEGQIRGNAAGILWPAVDGALVEIRAASVWSGQIERKRISKAGAERISAVIYCIFGGMAALPTLKRWAWRVR